MVQTRNSDNNNPPDPISTQLAAIAAKLEAIETMKEDIAALKEGDRSRSRGSKNSEGESSWRGRQSYRPYNKIDFLIFSGGDPRGWLLKAEKYFRYYQIPDEEKVEIASMHLEGDALDLYSWLSNGQFIFWEELVQAFTKNFGLTEFENPDECGDKYGPRHHCKTGTFKVLEANEDVEESFTTDLTNLDSDKEETAEISLHAILGKPHPTTMKINDLKITQDFYPFSLGGVDPALGVQWLATLNTVQANWKELFMIFSIDGKRYKLQGIVTGPHKSSSFQYLAVEPEVTPCIPSPLQPITIYSTVFKERQHLPRVRSQTHSILLLPNSTPPNICPYRYPYSQKNEIEKQVEELVVFLGHVVNSKGVSVEEEKISAVRSWHVPSTVKEVRVLRLPDFSKPFIIECDASSDDVGAILSQEDHPLAYFSKGFSPSNRFKSAYDRELLALVMAVQKWSHYLLGRHFFIRTDHYTLKFSLEQRITSTEQQRLLLKLMLYDFSIIHKAGKENKRADALSRRPHSGELLTLIVPYCVKVADIKAGLQTDPFTNHLISKLNEDSSSVTDFSLVNQLLFYQGRLVIPEILLAKDETRCEEFCTGMCDTPTTKIPNSLSRQVTSTSTHPKPNLGGYLHVLYRWFTSIKPFRYYLSRGGSPKKICSLPDLVSSLHGQRSSNGVLQRDSQITWEPPSLFPYVGETKKPPKDPRPDEKSNKFEATGTHVSVGSVAYELELPPEAKIHPVFHVSMLKPARGSFSSLPVAPLPITKDWEIDLQPSSVVTHRWVYEAGCPNLELLVSWCNRPIEESTWETYDLVAEQFPAFRLEDKAFYREGSNDKDTLKVYSKKRNRVKAANMELNYIFGNWLNPLGQNN
ncbi:retrotransposon gag domain, retroviral aspartyl protease [Tanacetum coccineum]